MERSTNSKHAAIYTLGFLFFVTMLTDMALSVERKDLIGKWKWQNYTVEVKECSTNPSQAEICIVVITGVKYPGMELLSSRLEKRGGDFYAKITDPATKEIYNTRFKQENRNNWTLSGCTVNGVCASGKFIRIK